MFIGFSMRFMGLGMRNATDTGEDRGPDLPAERHAGRSSFGGRAVVTTAGANERVSRKFCAHIWLIVHDTV